MEKVKGFLKKFVKEEEGLELTEYALMGAIICVMVVGTIILLKNEIITAFTNIINAMQGKTPA